MKDGMLNRVVSRQGRYKKYLFVLLFTVCCLLSTAAFADEVHSRAAVVMNASTGKILYAKNPDLRCQPASTTKLMTALIVMENARLNDIVRISRNVANTPPHKAGFREGDELTVEELLYAALLGSANDAAVALAEAVAGSESRFVELMNKKALAIGADNTRFINATGLPGTEQYTTASDLSKIMNYALKYPKLREIIGTRVTEISTEKGKSIFLKNTDRLLWSEEDLIGGKTGYTRKARHCFVCAAERDNETVIIALLGSPSRSDLWKETGTLIGKGFEVIGNNEKPFIYLAKTDYDYPAVKKASYKDRGRLKGKNKRSKSKPDNIITKKTGKQTGTVLTAKKKGKTKIFAKNKKGNRKSCRIAKRNLIDKPKG
jgi:serine-type D-Ala-D-Ala carboxypeptidase (penicillin-binding protein 5/6)